MLQELVVDIGECLQEVGCVHNIPTLETRRQLGQVNFCKDFWDCYKGQEKKLANS